MKPTLLPGLRGFAAGTLVLVVAGVLLVRARDREHVARSFAALSLVSSLRAAAATGELEDARSDALLWSGFGGLTRRMVELEDAWGAMGPGAALRLENLYVRENPYPEAERYLLADPGDGSLYSGIHADFQPRVREFLNIHAYQDVLLVNPSGRVVYDFRKGAEFATDLMQGPWRETPLAEVARAGLSLEPGTAAFSDFVPYEPAGGEWALFLASPVGLVGRSAGRGSLVFQISPERIGQQLIRTSQQRGSSFTVILGDGYRLKGLSPWIEGADTLDPLEAEARERALREGAGSMTLRGSDGRRVLAAWEPVSFEGIQWVVLSQVDLGEVRAEEDAEQRAVVVVLLLFWLAWGALTLGRIRPTSMARHRI